MKLDPLSQRNTQPLCLPGYRPRALTLTLDPLDHSSTQRSTEHQPIFQTSSPFFVILPLQLRLHIYQMFFLRRKLHIECEFSAQSEKWVTWCFACLVPHQLPLHADPCHLRKADMREAWTPYYYYIKFGLRLLLTCRQA